MGAETKPVLIFTARAAGACGAAGQMVGGTKEEARTGAEQIGNFLPVPLPRAQTLLGSRAAFPPWSPQKCVVPWGGLTPHQLLWPILELGGETQNPDTPNPKQQNPVSVLLLTWSCESRTPVPQPQPPLIPERCWGGTGVPCRVPPRRHFPLPLQFSYLFPAKLQLRRPDPSSLLIINFYCSSRREHVCRWAGVAVAAVTRRLLLLSSQLLNRGFRLSPRRIEQREALKDVAPGCTSPAVAQPALPTLTC